MAYKAELKNQYDTKIKAELKSELALDNVMAVPTLTKIIVNAGIGKEAQNSSTAVEEFVADIAQITGQKPVVTKSKKAIANFKLRENMDNGIMVTLRGDRMWDFFDKLVNVVLPRVRDFRGVSPRAFDGRGNYALGLKEQTVFPEIDTDKVVKIRPLQVVIVTSAANDEQGRLLLKKLGMPFRQESIKEKKSNK
jgi:large subunit ribosomal protein L5